MKLAARRVSILDSRLWRDKTTEEKYAGLGSSRGKAHPDTPKRKFQRKIVVDIEGYGDVTTLSEALELAQEGTVIKLCEGVHICKATIKVGGIKIEPYYKDRPAYLLGDEGPAIKIDVPMDDDQD